MSVMNRKMFNRVARKELRKKGGIADVQHFRNAGPVVGQVGSGIPGVELGRTFLAPYQTGTRGGFSFNQKVLKKVAEGGVGSLSPLELGVFNTMRLQQESQKDADYLRSFGDAGFRGLAGLRDAAAQVIEKGAKYGSSPLAGMLSGIVGYPIQSNVPDINTVGGRIASAGTSASDGSTQQLMKDYGFEFFPTAGEELDRFKRRQKNIDANTSINLNELLKGKPKGNLVKETGDPVPEEKLSDPFIQSLKGEKVVVDPKTGNVKVLGEGDPDPFGKKSSSAAEIAAEGPGKQLDTAENIEDFLGEGKSEEKETFPDPTGGFAAKGKPEVGGDQKTSDIEPPIAKPPELVKEVFKTGNEEQKKNVIDDIIKQFTDRAPKYEGINQGLAIAKIGFAMAAGESPNALTNIAKALNDGADMLIKDKKEKDAFNRQIKLSGLQLGLTEQFKISSEERLIEREMAKEGRKPLFFVADKNLNFNGVDYEKGETVAIPTSFITEKGLPKGFTTSDLAKAALDKQAALTKLINQQKKDAIIPSKTHQDYLEKVSVATGDFVSANSMRNLVEANIVRNAEKEITGVGPAFTQLVNKAYSAAGIETGKEYENVDAFNKDMRIVSNLLLKDLLGEGSKNVSNIDRKLADEIVGLASAYGGYVFQDPDLINTRLQNVLTRIDEKERSALAIIDSVQQASLGYTNKLGQPIAYDLPKDIVTAQDIKSGVAGKAKYKLVNGIYVRA